jgi:DNA-binding response OmpR family regulator
MAQQATVLIIADIGDPERAAVEAACAAAGFAPSVEPSAEAATGKLTAKRYDALIVHLGTPGAALASMRARGKLLRSRIPVIALVDADDEATFARAYRAGADEVLLLERPEWLTARLRALPRSAIPQPGNARGDAVVADADRTRAEVIERVLRDAGFRVEVAVDGFSTRLQTGRPSLKVAIVDASLDDVAALIVQAKSKGARCAWVVRARPEQLDEIREKLTRVERLSVVSAYGPPDDVLFEVNRLIEPRSADGRSEGRLLHGGILRLHWAEGADDIGYSYNISAAGIFVRTLAAPVGSTVNIELVAPKTEEKIRLRCDVVWRREFGATRKEPVPAGFALQITGGDVVAWNRVCPRTSTPPEAAKPRGETTPLEASRPEDRATAIPGAPTPADSPKPPVVAPVATPSNDVEIRPRESQSSVEEMLASVLSETSPADDELPGSAPLNIDGGAVVELHTPAKSETPSTDDQVTAVHDSSVKAEAVAYTIERARQELLSDALDATKTPLAVPRSPTRPAPPRASLVPRVTESKLGASIAPPRVDSRVPRPDGPLRSERAPRPESAPRAEATDAKDTSPGTDSSRDTGFATETRRKSDRPPENMDLSDITPASIGFDLSEDGRIIEAVRTLPPVAERPPAAVVRVDARPSSRPMQPASRGGTLAGTGRPPQPVESLPPPAARYARPEAVAPEPPPVAPVLEVMPPSISAASVAASPAAPAPSPAEAAPPPAEPTFFPAEPARPRDPATRVVAHADALETGDTMRPAAAGLAEAPSEPPPPLAGFAPQRTPSFQDTYSPSAAPELHSEMPRSGEMGLPKRRSLAGVWVALAVVIGGGAAVFATPSLRQAATATKTVAPPPVVTQAAPPSGVEKASEVVAPKESPADTASAVAPSAPATVAEPTAKAPATAEPTATAPATAAPAPSAPATAPAAPAGAELDDAALAALQPGQGYLYVESPLATNVYVYANLAGTTNQRIPTKCGPRFIRLGTTLGNWQGEGQVQIVKCGALTRVEMGK